MTVIAEFHVEPGPKGDRRAFLPVSKRHCEARNRFPAMMVARLDRLHRMPMMIVWGFDDEGSGFRNFVKLEKSSSLAAKVCPDMNVGGSVPLFTEDDVLVQVGGGRGRVVLSDVPALYEWMRDGWWPEALTVIEPAKRVVVPEMTGLLVRWPKSMSDASTRADIAGLAHVAQTLLLALPEKEWGSPVQLREAVRREGSVLQGREPGPLVGGDIPCVVAVGEEIHCEGGVTFCPEHVPDPLTCVYTSSLVSQAQVRLSEIMLPWLEAWAEALPHAPGLMLGHFASWLIQANLFRRSYLYSKYHSIFWPELAAELHDIGVPLQAAKQLIELPSCLGLPLGFGRRCRMGPFDISNNYWSLLNTNHPLRLHVDGITATFPVGWNSVASFLLEFAAQQRIVVV